MAKKQSISEKENEAEVKKWKCPGQHGKSKKGGSP